jgi:hypothetical protein
MLSKSLNGFALLGFAAALSVARQLALAVCLSAQSFGTVSVTLASSLFFSTIIGLGLVDHTSKTFPRLAGDGRYVDILAEADLSSVGLLKRLALLLGFVGVLIATSGSNTDIWLATAFCFTLSFSQATNALFASAQRASFQILGLAQAQVFRAVITAFLAIGGALTWGWIGALAGELLGGLLGATYSRRLAHKAVNSPPIEKATGTKPDEQDLGGYWVSASLLMQNAVFFLDRPMLAAIYGTWVAGTYGVLALLITCVSVVVGIIAQKVGPKLIWLQRQGESIATQVQLALYSSMFGVFIAVALGVTVLAIIHFGFFSSELDKYRISVGLLLPVIVLSVLQVSVFFDYILFSHDKEKQAFGASIAYALAAAACFGIAFKFNLTIVHCLWLLAAAKGFHILLQGLFISKLTNMPAARS